MQHLAVFLTRVALDAPLFDPIGDPLRTHLELDAACWERRKVHVCADGRIELASFEIETEHTGSSWTPIPSLDEINADPQSSGRVSTHRKFDAFWTREGPGPR